MSEIDRVVQMQQNLVFLGGGANSLIRERRSLSGQLVANRSLTAHRRKYVAQLRATHEISLFHFQSYFARDRKQQITRIFDSRKSFIQLKIYFVFTEILKI